MVERKLFHCSLGKVQVSIVKRELIKLHVLENSELSAREAAEQLAEATESEVVQVIGSRFVLYKRNPKKPVFDLK